MGTHDFIELPIVMERYAKSIKANAVAGMKTIAKAGYDEVVDATPVKTGTAVSNWNIALGAPDMSVRETLGPGAGSARKAAARGVIASITDGIAVYVTNAVSYIKYLEHGSATTIAHNMISRGVQKMALAAKTIKILKQL